jgi:parvulin-like peptidyl-prolyl isomerase
VDAKAVTDKDVEARYEAAKERQFTQPETVRISHILIRLPEDDKLSTEEKERTARTRAETLLKKLRAANGANFEQVAKESSDDRATGAVGGKLPSLLAKGANPFGADWDTVVFAAPVGLIDPPVQTPLGYHLVRVDAKTPGRVIPLSEVRDQVRQAILDERRAQALDELVLRLRTQAKIETGKF